MLVVLLGVDILLSLALRGKDLSSVQNCCWRPTLMCIRVITGDGRLFTLHPFLDMRSGGGRIFGFFWCLKKLWLFAAPHCVEGQRECQNTLRRFSSAHGCCSGI